MRIAINGMGRIGRLLFRRLINDSDVDVVAVNDIMETANLVYLLKYDSVYGSINNDICLRDNSILIENKKIVPLRRENPAKLPWKELNIDIVLECSGKFTSNALAEQHLEAGAKKVLLSTTGSADIPLFIYGFNHHKLNSSINIFSPGGCMTNCATHVLYILNSIGIESAQINILHSYTSRQELVDTSHKHYRRGRAAAESIIPVEVDLGQSLERLLPLQNKIATVSTRVPVANGAMADITIQLEESRSATEINMLFRKASENEYKNIIAYTEDPLVSADIKGNTHSCVIDGTLTSVVGKQVKLIAWFDNEYGYTTRMIDSLKYWEKKLNAEL